MMGEGPKTELLIVCNLGAAQDETRIESCVPCRVSCFCPGVDRFGSSANNFKIVANRTQVPIPKGS